MITLTVIVALIVLAALIVAVLEFLWPVVLVALALLLLDIVTLKMIIKKLKGEKKNG